MHPLPHLGNSWISIRHEICLHYFRGFVLVPPLFPAMSVCLQSLFAIMHIARLLGCG